MHPNPVIQHIQEQLEQRQNRQQQINWLTSQLIRQLNIQDGDNIYLFLGQHKRCHNTQAIQNWISEVLGDIDIGDDQENTQQETYRQLKHEFLQLMPEIQ